MKKKVRGLVDGSGLLRRQQVESLLHGNPFSRVLVLRGETSRVGTHSRRSLGVRLQQSVNPLSRGIEVIHHVHIISEMVIDIDILGSHRYTGW